MVSYGEDVSSMRKYFNSGVTLPIKFRKKQLKQLKKLIVENKKELCDAIYNDIRRCSIEGECMELTSILNDIHTFLSKLFLWSKKTHVDRGIVQLLDKAAYIKKDPLGVVLIIGPWNYPILLTLRPMVGAIGAGNCVVLKPSEIAPESGKLLGRLFPKYFDARYVRVIEGGVAETTDLLKERFDHILFTGATQIGRIVMSAAAKHLTPVTLELGGQCPVIVDSNLDLRTVARRIAWGKFVSCGQICLAPNHIICYQKDEDALIKALSDAIVEFYSDQPEKSMEYSRIINSKHFARLKEILDKTGGRLAFGGHCIEKECFISPTIVNNVPKDDIIMSNEIFGPILPILTVNKLSEILDRLQNSPKPLALYIFSDNQKMIDQVLEHSSSGGVCINDVLLHIALDSLPFGGVGDSGMGRYNGKFSFDTFSHERGVLHRRLTGENRLWFRYPPYNDEKVKWLRRIMIKRTFPQCIRDSWKWLVPLVCGIFIGWLFTFLFFFNDDDE